MYIRNIFALLGFMWYKVTNLKKHIMKTKKHWTRSIFFVPGILIGLFLIGVVASQREHKKADPNKIFLLKAQITGSNDLIKEYDRKISYDVFLKDVKIDSIRNLQGNQEILKKEVEKLQVEIAECQDSIIFYKKIIDKDTTLYNKLTKYKK